MTSLSFSEKRVAETYTIYKTFFGDRKKYNLHKYLQEQRKRLEQNKIAQEEVDHQVAKHNQRFPFWHCVKDASDLYVADRFQASIQSRLENQKRRSYDVPMASKDMYNVLKDILSSSLEFDYLTVACVYDHTTLDVPQKMVLMIHDQGILPFEECIKHQERPLSPALITNVIGGRFDNSEKAILVTSEKTMHTRYLYKDFAKYQFHYAVPKHDKEMRICYGVKPETVSLITVHFSDCDVVLFPSLRDEDWKASSDKFIDSINCILYMNRYHMLH
jgi:hypothetical protein